MERRTRGVWLIGLLVACAGNQNRPASEPAGEQAILFEGLGSWSRRVTTSSPEAQRYFDYHHSANDIIEAVNERELKLGAAALAILCYVLAQEGL